MCMDDRPAHSRAANSAVQGQIWLKFELIQDGMIILVTSKNEEDPIKIEGARVATIQNIDFSISDLAEIRTHPRYCSYPCYLKEWRRSTDVMDVLVTSKNKEEPNKNEGARVATILNIDF